jgi:G3E family GTPase
MTMTEHLAPIGGTCAAGFESVRSVFRKNFTDRNEVGAAVAVWVDGDLVVNLWGGYADARHRRHWRENTLASVFSGTKGLTSTCLHLLADRGETAGADDARSIVDLMTDQLEFASVIVLNKLDRVDEVQKRQALSIIKALNPTAQVIESRFGRVPLASFLDAQSFDFELAQRNPGWAREMRGEHTPETEVYGISSFVFRAHRPFHPRRLMDFFESDWPGVVRSKGHFWLATRMDWVGSLAQAGGSLTHRAAGHWWAAAPRPIMLGIGRSAGRP